MSSICVSEFQLATLSMHSVSTRADGAMERDSASIALRAVKSKTLAEGRCGPVLAACPDKARLILHFVTSGKPTEPFGARPA